MPRVFLEQRRVNKSGEEIAGELISKRRAKTFAVSSSALAIIREGVFRLIDTGFHPGEDKLHGIESRSVKQPELSAWRKRRRVLAVSDPELRHQPQHAAGLFSFLDLLFAIR